MAAFASPGPVDELLSQAAQSAGSTEQAAAAVYTQFTSWSSSVDGAVWAGLLPIGFTLLVLHEHYRSQVDGMAFRTGYVFARAGVLVALLLGYGPLVRLITSVAGGWGAFVDWSDLLGPVSAGGQKGLELHSITHWQNTFDELPRFLFWLFLYGLVVVSSLFAMVATLLLTVSQGVLVAMLLILGKPALVASLVPGVGLGRSWARFLAMVAAWSTVGGTVATVVLGHKYMQNADVLIALGQPKDMLFVAAHYAVFGIFTLSVPFITSALFSGAIGAAPGVAAALFGGIMGARMLVSTGVGATKTAGRLGARAAGAGARGTGSPLAGPDGAPAGRVHKVPRPPPAPGGGARRSRSGAAPPSSPSEPRVAGGKAPRARVAMQLPDGSPGAARFAQTASPAQKRAFATRHSAPPHQRLAPPAANDAMRARLDAQRSALQQAYPDLRWNSARPGPEQRALIDELDADHGRYQGWERGAQGRGDLSEARQIAAGRAQAAAIGQAQPAAPYRGPAAAEPRRGDRPSPPTPRTAADRGRVGQGVAAPPRPAAEPARDAAQHPRARPDAAAAPAERERWPAGATGSARAAPGAARPARGPHASDPRGVRDLDDDPDRTAALRVHKLERRK